MLVLFARFGEHPEFQMLCDFMYARTFNSDGLGDLSPVGRWVICGHCGTSET